MASDSKTPPVVRTYLWRLRFKSPMAPSRAVWDVTIETTSPDYDVARIVAEDYLASKMAHPNTSPPIILEPFIAHSQDEVPKAKFAKLHQARADAAATVDGSSSKTGGKGPDDDEPARAPFSGESVGAGAPAPGPGGRAVQSNRHERIGS